MSTAVDEEFIALQAALTGSYFLERELGRGGMGIVYLARDVRLDRPVAIKLLPPALAARADLRERFMREARTSAKLSHPNIVAIFSVDEVAGFVFFEMAYVDGETVSQRVRTRGPMPPHEVGRMVREIAWALAYAHARGIVHRDIKPDNIMLERGSGRALVTDFGIAHLTEASALTEMGQVMGTAHFMSPEQAAGEPLDGRSDLYSLGVVAYFALSAKLPFEGPTVQAVLAKHLTQPPPALASVAPAVPRALAQAIERCLAKAPAARYASGEALAEAVTLASESRREMPAPLRVWVSKGDAFKYLYGFALTITPLEVATDPTGWDVLTLAFPFLVHGTVEFFRTRRVFAAGYDQGDLLLALREHLARRSEELAFEYDHDPPLLARLIRYLTYLALAFATALAAMMRLAPERLPFTQSVIAFAIAVIMVMGGSLLGLNYPGRRIKKRDIMSEMRLRFWRSSAGAWLGRLARRGLKARAGAATLAHRPTELAIGLAVSDLYESLPKAAQQRLVDLPDAIRRLEAEAQLMRRRMAELADQLATVTPQGGGESSTLERFGSDAGELAARRRDLAAQLGASRDAAGKRLAVAVTALENMRLDLLRLHAGAGSVEQLTAAIEQARRIGEEVSTVVEARPEVAGQGV